MRNCILGLDPSTRYFGWGLVQSHTGRVVAAGCWRLRAKGLLARHDELMGWLDHWQLWHRVDLIGIETQYTGGHASVMDVCRARGWAESFILRRKMGVPFVEVAPASRLKGVGLKGNAGKAAVVRLFRGEIAHLATKPEREGAADALAIARTVYAWREEGGGIEYAA